MTYLLKAVVRTIKGEKIREQGGLPAVVYGAGKDTVSLSLALSDFIKLYKSAGDSSLLDLEVDGKNVGKVLVQEVQYDPIKDVPIHVDFRRIDMEKVMRAPVVLKFIGESPAVKGLGGTLVRTLSEVTVECLPKDLVSNIDVDLSVLKTFEESIKVKDLVLSAGIKVVSPNADDLIAKVTPALTEDEIKAMEDAGKQMDISKIEVVGKKPEEEGAEGEEAATDKKEDKKEEKK